MTEIKDELFSDNQTDYSFSELIEDLERTGEILRRWDEGAPIVDGDNAPQQKPKKNDDEKKRKTIQ